MSGTYTVKIKLYGNETAAVKLSINTKKKEQPAAAEEAAPAVENAVSTEEKPSEE
jgi:hypothetical protein